MGIAVYVRTTRVDNPSVAYSYISSAAVKISNDILEVSGDGEHYLNGNKVSADDDEMISTLAGYALTKSFNGATKRIVVYALNLGDGHIIKIRANSKYKDRNGLCRH